MKKVIKISITQLEQIIRDTYTMGVNYGAAKIHLPYHHNNDDSLNKHISEVINALENQ